MRIWKGVVAVLALLALAPAAAKAQLAPRKVVAILDDTQNFGTTKRSVNFYDVTDLSGSNVFNQTPLFSVWTGYENDSQSELRGSRVDHGESAQRHRVHVGL